jgi:hypothetical protein
MSAKKYTVEEANALLPYLAPTLVELRDKLEAATKIRLELVRAATSNGGSTERDRWSRTLARVDELIERLQSWEVELRDVSTGLVDFPATIEGRDAWLCWRLGEVEVAHWHRPEDGLAGRRPL